jgi:hypothetical protein
VNKVADIAKLKLDCCPHVIESGDATMLSDDLEAALQAALMVVCHLEYEQIVKYLVIHKCLFAN